MLPVYDKVKRLENGVYMPQLGLGVYNHYAHHLEIFSAIGKQVK